MFPNQCLQKLKGVHIGGDTTLTETSWEFMSWSFLLLNLWWTMVSEYFFRMKDGWREEAKKRREGGAETCYLSLVFSDSLISPPPLSATV